MQIMQDATTAPRRIEERALCKMANLQEERGTGSINVGETRSSRQGTSGAIESTRSKRHTNLTKSEIIKREDSFAHSRKRKGKVGEAHIAKEQSLSKKVPQRRSATVSQQDQGSGIEFEKRDQAAARDLQESKRKRSREGTSAVESQHGKTLTKPRKLTRAKNRFSPDLTNIKQDSYCRGQIKENPTHATSSIRSSETENDKSKSQSRELVHLNRSPTQNVLPSQQVKWKTKKKNISIRRKAHDKAVENIWTRKFRPRDKSGAGKSRTTTKKVDPGDAKPKTTHLVSGSHALHALRKPTLSRKVKKRLSDDGRVLETSTVKEQPGGVQINGTGNLDVKLRDTMLAVQSKETATALKLANDTSGFVRMALKSVEDAKSINLKEKGLSQTGKENVTRVDDKPNRILSKVATRYKSTLESLVNTKTMTAEKMIEELGAIRLASKRNVPKAGKLGKRHICRSTRATSKKDLEEEAIGRDIVKENAQDLSKHRQSDARHIKLGRKTRKHIENQMKKFGLIDKSPQNQEVTARTTPPRKSKSPMVSGFDRLISGAGGNKEFESALAQIVSSPDDELGWTKEQEKALQNAYLSIKETDGCFWNLISKEVPGRSAKECYNRFYSRHPTPSVEAKPSAARVPSEFEYPLSLSDPPDMKSQANVSPKVTRKQKQLEAHKTIRNILGNVDGMEGYKTSSTTVESNHLEKEQDMASVLDREEDENAVMLQPNPVKDCKSIDLLSSHELESDSIHNSLSNSFFENVVVSGVSTSSDKENNQPRNGQESSNKKLGMARVELILKQVDYGENLPDDSRYKTAANNPSRKKKIIKSNNVYLHSKDALDFGDTTLDAIQRAKQELRNVFSRTGSRGGRFFDVETDQVGE